MSGYRLCVGLAIAALFAAQRSFCTHLDGPARVVSGYFLSIAFIAFVAEFASLAIGRRFAGEEGARADHIRLGAVLAVASATLVPVVFARPLGRPLALLEQSPPTIALMILLGWWLVMTRRAIRRGLSARGLAVALGGLVVGARVLVMWHWPFDRLDGDMLATIDRGLDELLAGRFPYVDFPPPMPYLPGIFLAYAPAKMIGCDLRLTNLAIDGLTVAAAVLLPPVSSRSRPDGPTTDQVALPLLMMHPVWIHYSVNTQYSPCLLAAVLLARAVGSGGPWAQAVMMGLAVGSNQMLGACGPILLGHWIGRLGMRRALGLSAVSMSVFGAMIAPFFLWHPAAFLRVALLNREPFPPELMAGRLTLQPIASAVIPHAEFWLSLASIAVACWAARRTRHPEVVVASMALGLCGALLFQPVSFSHYFLPVLALVATAPVPLGRRTTDRSAGPPPSSRLDQGPPPRRPTFVRRWPARPPAEHLLQPGNPTSATRTEAGGRVA